jgi:hypothetical protein
MRLNDPKNHSAHPGNAKRSASFLGIKSDVALE